ncbi:MAG TPA: hypothetical protein DHW40_07015 [Microbacterium sp.]|nr:hypothetical protein [Microbacterium sp.]
MFGLSFEKFVLVAFLAAMIIGPGRLPALAQRLGELIRAVRGIVDAARARAESEVGLTADDWRSLDPRQYDPRRIVREALLPDSAASEPGEEVADPVAATRARSTRVTGSSGHPRRLFDPASAGRSRVDAPVSSAVVAE